MLKVNDFLAKALNLTRTLPDLSFIHKNRRVLLIGFTPHWLSFLALVSVVLVHRGCKIHFLWTPMFEHDNSDQLQTAIQMYQEISPTLLNIDDERFRPINIHDVPMKMLSSELITEVERQAIHDTIHLTREVHIDINGRHRNVYRHRLHILQQFAGVLETLLEDNRYDILLTPNGQIFEWGIARRLAIHHNIPVSTLDGFQGGSDFQICTSWTQPAINWDTTIIADAWKANEPHKATAEVKANVKKIMGIFDNIHDVYSHQFVKSGQAKSLRSLLCADENKPIALVLPSLGHEKHNRIKHYGFSSHVEWFETIVQYLSERSDCTVVIRAHPYPNDAKNDPLNYGSSTENPGPILERLFDELPPHFRFIGPKDDVNTYDLLSIGDFVLTHHSTAGLEAALTGKAAVTCSTIHYTGKGFTYDAKTKEEYLITVNDLICNPAKRQLTERQVELAQCYADVFYFKWPNPFPWNMMRPFFRYQDYPLERVLSLEIILSPFMETFDRLVNPEKIDDATRAKQVERYVDVIRNGQKNGDSDNYFWLLGRLELVDLTDLRIQWPITFDTLIHNWKWATDNISNTVPTPKIQGCTNSIVDEELVGIVNVKEDHEVEVEVEVGVGVGVGVEEDPQLIVNGFKGFNIIRQSNEFHAILQREGEFVSSKLLSGGYSCSYSGHSLTEVKNLILAKYRLLTFFARAWRFCIPTACQKTISNYINYMR